MMKETLRHKEALEFYYALGEQRSYPKVASKFTVSRTSVKKWAKAFNWQGRVELRDIENSRKLEEKTNATVVNSKANYRAIIQASIVKYVEALKAGNVKVETVADLDRLIKADLLLMGEATDRPEIRKAIDEFSDEELRRIIEGRGGNRAPEETASS